MKGFWAFPSFLFSPAFYFYLFFLKCGNADDVAIISRCSHPLKRKVRKSFFFSTHNNLQLPSDQLLLSFSPPECLRNIQNFIRWILTLGGEMMIIFFFPAPTPHHIICGTLFKYMFSHLIRKKRTLDFQEDKFYFFFVC